MKIQLPIIWTLLLLLGVLLTNCEQESITPREPSDPSKPPLEINYTSPPISYLPPNGRASKFAENVSYGSHKKNVFDIFTLENTAPTPLVVFLHAGGFTGGDKSQAYQFQPIIQQFLANGIAFATVNYRLLDHSNNGVITCLNDIKRAVQFMRYYAPEFNIDKNRIACYGISAGAGAALWLGTHDDMAIWDSRDGVDRQSTRITATVALGTQATYDLVRWEEIFAPFNFKINAPGTDLQSLYDFYDITSVNQLYTPAFVSYRANVDMLKMFTSDDPPVYVYNNGSSKPPVNDGELYHHPFHALAVRDAANRVGVENQVYAPGMRITDRAGEDPVKFLTRHLKR